MDVSLIENKEFHVKARTGLIRSNFSKTPIEEMKKRAFKTRSRSRSPTPLRP